MQDAESTVQTKSCLIVARDLADVKAVLLHALEAMGFEIEVFGDRDASSDEPHEELSEFLRERSYDRIIAVGGDGTLRLVVHAMHALGRAIPIMLVPLGTANDFSRTLLETHPNRFVEFEDGISQPVLCDTARVSSKGDLSATAGQSENTYFINMMVIGGGAENSLTISSDLKQVVGSAAYLKQLGHSLVAAGSFSVRVVVRDEPGGGDRGLKLTKERFDCNAIFIANGRTCGGGYSIVPTADPTDGMLDVVIVKDITMWEKLKLAASFFSEQHLESEAIEWFRTSNIQLEFDQPQAVTLDGECIQAVELFVSAEHQCQGIGLFQIQRP